jgi:methylmalonyl-CoA mutase
MMESRTDELIHEVEAAVGMTAYIASGMAKLCIKKSATKEQGRIDSGHDVIVGVNKYRLHAEQEKEGRQDVLQIDNNAVRQKQVDRLNQSKRTRNEEDVLGALSALEIGAKLEVSRSRGDNPNNLLTLSIHAARVRCFLG